MTQLTQEQLNVKLLKAAYFGNIDAAKEALEQGADINAKDWSGFTPLNIAALKGHTKMAKLLLENSANVNAKNAFRYTPLDDAALKGHADIADLLKQHGGVA